MAFSNNFKIFGFPFVCTALVISCVSARRQDGEICNWSHAVCESGRCEMTRPVINTGLEPLCCRAFHGENCTKNENCCGYQRCTDGKGQKLKDGETSGGMRGGVCPSCESGICDIKSSYEGDELIEIQTCCSSEANRTCSNSGNCCGHLKCIDGKCKDY